MDQRRVQWAGSVRRVGLALITSWNDDLVPSLPDEANQARTISAWGQRLAATGIHEIGVMDYDRVEPLNRGRMIGVTRRDTRLRRRKVDVAARAARRASTGRTCTVNRHHDSICSPTGLVTALDYDVIFGCVDRPWRAVLNSVAHADLIPVIEGVIALDSFETGGIRGATRRTQTATPGPPCLTCAQQIDMTEVALEMSGDLDDPETSDGRTPAGLDRLGAVRIGGVTTTDHEAQVDDLGVHRSRAWPCG
jgi:hypothetical protein